MKHRVDEDNQKFRTVMRFRK